MLTSLDMNKILVDATLHRPPSITTPEALEFRRKMDEQVAEIVKAHFEVHIPGEIPDMDDP